MQRFEICDFVCKKVCIKWGSTLPPVPAQEIDVQSGGWGAKPHWARQTQRGNTPATILHVKELFRYCEAGVGEPTWETDCPCCCASGDVPTAMENRAKSSS
jgi:hypothetical protein